MYFLLPKSRLWLFGFFLMPGILLFSGLQKVSAQIITYDWVGTTNTAWNLAANWQVGGIAATTSPILNTDIIRIGVVITPVKQLDIGLNVTCASITFGGLVPVTTSPNRGFTVTINTPYRLTVTNININHSANSATQNITNECIFTGTGDIVCTNTTSGNATTPVASSSSTVNRAHVSQLSFGVANLTLTDINLRTTSNTVAAVNNATFQLSSGNMTLSGQIKAVDDAYVSTNVARFVTDTTPFNTSLTLTNANPFSTTLPLAASRDFDFTNDTNGNTGSGTVTYAANTATQEIYTTGDDPVLGVNPRNYDNISFTGAAIKRVHGNKDLLGMTVAANWTSEGGAINLTTNNPLITIGGSLTNSTTINQGSGDIDVVGSVSNSGTLTLGTGNIYIGGNYANTGTYTQSTGTTVFDGTTQTLTDNSMSGTAFNKVLFTGGGTKALQNNKFAVSPIGLLTLANSSVLAAGGNLTLRSNASGSATVNTIPAGCSVTGEATVERYMKGSYGRSYRLISSAVYNPALTSAGNNFFTAVPLKASTLITGPNPGAGANDFDDSNLDNPSIWVYREADTYPKNTRILDSDYKGIYTLNTKIPVGTGLLFFNRGNRTNANAKLGLAGALPVPEDNAITFKGTLNQQQVAVKMINNVIANFTTPNPINPATRYYFNGSQAPSAQLSFTNNTGSTADVNTNGFNLIGNPYPATIDLSLVTFGSSIGNTIHVFNPNNTNRQFSVWNRSNSTTDGNGASQYIASGQGFFVKATAAGANATVTFNEANKVLTPIPVPGGTPPLLMGKPVTVPEAPPIPRIMLRMHKDSADFDGVGLYFNAGASAAMDENDAIDLDGMSPLVYLSALSQDGKRLAINMMPPVPEINNVKLFVDATTSGLFTLRNAETENIPQQYDIWLKDNFMKDSLDFRANDTYTFRITKSDTASFGKNRFEIILRKKMLAPYQLISFTGEKTTGGNKLSWKVLNEYGYTGFVIERIDGTKNYISLHELQSDSKGSYTYIDKYPLAGSNFYRLKQVDLSNKVAYSKIIEIKDNSNNSVAIYPNPATNWLNVNFDKVHSVKMRIIDSKGNQLKSLFFTGKTGRIDISGMKAGVYFIEVTDTASYQKLLREKWIKN